MYYKTHRLILDALGSRYFLQRDTKNVSFWTRFWCQNRGKGDGNQQTSETCPNGHISGVWQLETPKTHPCGRVFGVRMDGRGRGMGSGGGGGVDMASGLGCN